MNTHLTYLKILSKQTHIIAEAATKNTFFSQNPESKNEVSNR